MGTDHEIFATCRVQTPKDVDEVFGCLRGGHFRSTLPGIEVRL